MNITPIAYYHTKLKTKFGVPRQSGIVPELRGVIVFESEYCNADALRGIEGFDYLWLIWGFSLNSKKQFLPITVFYYFYINDVFCQLSDSFLFFL